MPALQPYTTEGSPSGTTSDVWEDAPTTPFAGTSATLPDATEMLVVAIGQARNDGGTHQAELEARVGSTRIGMVGHRQTFSGGNGATSGGQLFAVRRITTGIGDALNFRRRSSSSGAGTLLDGLQAVAWPLADIPTTLRHHSESANDDAIASQPPDVAGWVPVGVEGAGQLRFTAAETGNYQVLASCELFPLTGMPAARSLTARLAYREVGTPTWTFVDTNDYFFRDPDPSLDTSRVCQGFSEPIALTTGTEYVIAILCEGDESNGLMGVGRIGVHAFAPSAYESIDTGVAGTTAVGGSATVDVAAAAVMAAPGAGTRSFLCLTTFAASGGGIGFWTDHFVRSDEGTPGDAGDDDSGYAYSYGGDNFDADQNLRIMAMRFLNGISADTIVTPRITTLGGAGNNYDRIVSSTFSLYAPDPSGSFVDLAGEADADVSASGALAVDQALSGEADAGVDASASISTATTTVEVSGQAAAIVEVSAAASVDQALSGGASAGAEASASAALDLGVAGEAEAGVASSGTVQLDIAVGGEASASVYVSGSAVEAIEGVIDISGETVVVVETVASLALDQAVVGEAAVEVTSSAAVAVDQSIAGEADVVVDVSGSVLGPSTIDTDWVESILSDSDPFTSRTP